MWVQFVLAGAALLVALGVIWQKGVKPAANFITKAEEMLPVMINVTDKLSDPEIVSVIVAIAKQFQADSGSSLRDVVDRLEEATSTTQAAVDALIDHAAATAQTLTVGQEASRLLAQEDRVLLADVRSELRRVNVKVDDAAAGAVIVADDLEAAHARAEGLAAGTSEPGEAADAGMIRPVDEP